MKRIFPILLFVVAAGASPTAQAMNVSLYNPATAGISEFSWSFSYDTQLQIEVLDVYEVWTQSDASFLHIDGLAFQTNVWVRKHVLNDTGADWVTFNHELLDPSGHFEDIFDDPVDMPVPEGYSNSNDVDGLSFAQDQGLPRTSTKYSGTTLDEESGNDFMEFVDGTILGIGSVADRSDVMTFGLRDNDNPSVSGGNQGFLLRQIANEGLVVEPPFREPIPEPTTILLLGGGLIGGAVGRMRKRAAARAR